MHVVFSLPAQEIQAQPVTSVITKYGCAMQLGSAKTGNVKIASHISIS
jgi:hypothetical protein